MFEELYADPERLEQFMHAMAGISAGNFHAPRREVRLLAGTATLTDVGGATGQLSAHHRAAPPAHAVHQLRPPRGAPIAERSIAAAGIADRVTRVNSTSSRTRSPRLTS